MNSSNLMVASQQWATRPQDQRFTTLEDLAANVSARRLRSRSRDINVGELGVKLLDSGELVINSAISAASPTHWSFGQFAATVGAPGAYLRTLSPELAAANLNYGLKHTPVRGQNKFMVLTNPDGGPNTLQAVTSPTYGRIWDADCVASVQRIVERSGGKFFNPPAYNRQTGQPEGSGLYASDHDVFMFLIDGGSRLDAGPRAQLNRGFICWNSETGARTFGLMTFLFNEVCGNHIIWGEQNVNQLIIRHSAGGPGRFDGDAMPTLRAYCDAQAGPELATIKRAQQRLLPADETELNALLAPFKFTRSEVSEAVKSAEREEGGCRTVWDLVQGFTAYARDFDYVDARVDLEKRAGKLLELVAE